MPPLFSIVQAAVQFQPYCARQPGDFSISGRAHGSDSVGFGRIRSDWETFSVQFFRRTRVHFTLSRAGNDAVAVAQNVERIGEN